MRDRPVQRALFSQKGEIDEERIHYMDMMEGLRKGEEKTEEKMKRPVNINIFREETRRQQR